MAGSRNDFLEQVRVAVAAGNRAGVGADIPARGVTGYQGAGSDPVACFVRELESAGGKGHVVGSPDELFTCLDEILQALPGSSLLLEQPTFLDGHPLADWLRGLGKQVVRVDELANTDARAALFEADIGISGVTRVVAETGSVVMGTGPGRPRSTSLLPRAHIAIAARSQIVPDLFDLFTGPPALPSCLTLITGPSKTGDIELRLVTGVHGPGDVHVIICSWA